MDERFSIIIGSVVGSFLLLSLLSAVWSRHKVRSAIKRLRKREHGKTGGKEFHAGAISSLPPIVQKYFTNTLQEGQRYIDFIQMSQEADFRTQIDGDWSHLSANVWYGAFEPGMVWKARFGTSLLPFKTASLEFIHGKGHGLVRLLGTITLLEPHGYEADITLLSRYLMEAVWFPTVLLPNRHIEWSPVSELSAKAEIHFEGLRASAIFTFTPDGQIENIVTHDKFRDFKGSFEKEQFTLHCKNFKQFQNITIPTEVEFVWNLPSKDFSYGKFRVADIRYEFS
jgi:hypothetical protein